MTGIIPHIQRANPLKQPIWDYVCNFRHYPAPFPNCYALQGNLKFFRENKAKEMFPEGAFQGYLADFAELKSWLLSKWMWNADLPMKDLLDDFFAGYYGKGAPFVREYFEKLHRRQLDWSRSGEHPLLIYEPVGGTAFDDAFWEDAAALFEKAKAAVAGDAPVYGRNVRGTAFSVDYVRFMRLTEKTNVLLWMSREQPSADARKKAKRLAQAMLPVMDEFKPAPPRRVTCGVIEEKDLRYCHTKDMGGLRDDPQADDGRALWLANTHYEWSTAMPMSVIRYDADTTLRLRVRCRVERKPGRTGEAFWAGVYDRGRHADARSVSIKVQDITSDGYAWYDIGTFRPNDKQKFWIGPGRFGKDGQSNILGLWVDKIELSVLDSK